MLKIDLKGYSQGLNINLLLIKLYKLDKLKLKKMLHTNKNNKTLEQIQTHVSLNSV